MCGIAGIVELGAGRPDRAALASMVDVLKHRGPDERGTHAAGRCALGHVRLSIVDLATGQQPMCNEDRTLWIVFNGEIYNHVELRQELEAKGHRFRTRSDTEVIIHLYEEEGPACVRRMNGQWAFGLWDERRERLFLARDQAGITPLFYAPFESRLLFGSEAKSLLAYPGFPRRFDPRALDDVMTTWSTLPPRTAFEGIFELPPAHTLTLRDGRFVVKPYWQLEYRAATPGASEEALCDEVLDGLVDAARLRFQRADVPVGAYLSGGLDSTLIVSIVRRFTDAPLRTFSVRLEDQEFDEGAFQQEARAYLDVEHQEVLCRKQDIALSFPDVIWHAEKPVVRTAPAPMFLLSQRVRDAGFKVVLTGEGADEMFGGYDIFKEAKVRRLIAEHPDSRMRPLLLRALYPYLPGLQRQSPAYLEAFFLARPEDLRSPLFSHLPRFNLGARNRLFFSEAVKSALAEHDTLAEVAGALPAGFGGWDHLSQAQFLEATYLLPGYLLSSQGDRMIMAHGVEGRYPYLDQRIVELACKLPARLKLRVLNEKFVLKRAGGELIPDFLRRRPKQPFRAPEAASFFEPTTGQARAPYIEELLGESKLVEAGIFNPKPVRMLVEKARRGNAGSIRDGMALASILSTQLLVEQFVHRFGRLTA